MTRNKTTMKFLSRFRRPRIDTSKNLLITGVPRSGTTLSCHLLNGLDDCVALHEPMEVRDLMSESNTTRQLQQIHTFFHDNRALIKAKGRAISIHRDGKVPDNPVVEANDKSGKRKLDISRGEIDVPGTFTNDTFLVIKHPAVFTGLLPRLVTEFQVFAVVRNPISVLGSWMTVPFGVREGHAPAAEGVDQKLKEALANIDDTLDRQIHLLSWFFERYKTYLPASAVIRYEDVITTQGQALAVVVPSAKNLTAPLKSRNKNKIYDSAAMKEAGQRLLSSSGAFWDFYQPDDVKKVLSELG